MHGRITLIALATLFGMAACSGEETALRVTFVPDSRLNTEHQLLQQLDRLELVLDAEGGFAGVDGPGSYGELDAWEADGDGELELFLRRDLRGRDSLPRLSLLPGRSADRTFALSAVGTREAEIRAVSWIAAVTFTPGATSELLVPFDLRAPFRALRVRRTTPEDGQTDVPHALAAARFELSKQILVSSLAGNIRVLYRNSYGHEVPVPGSLAVGVTEVDRDGLKESRSTVAYQFSCGLNSGLYRLVVSSKLKDAGGAGLDQDAGAAGSTPFEARFTIKGTPSADACNSAFSCSQDQDCNPPGQLLYKCSGKRCVRDDARWNCCTKDEMKCHGDPDKGVVCVCPRPCES